jgi:hypothetical protein
MSNDSLPSYVSNVLCLDLRGHMCVMIVYGKRASLLTDRLRVHKARCSVAYSDATISAVIVLTGVHHASDASI